MRSFVSIFVAVLVAIILSSCGSSESSAATSSAIGTQASAVSNTPKSLDSAANKADGPTIFGVDGELQNEVRVLLAHFIEQRQVPGDAAENLTKAFDSAMETIRRPANEFGIEPDTDGNLEWPEGLEEKVKSLRAEFDAKTLFDAHEIDLPEWAKPLLDEYNANSISPIRKELLFRLASGTVILDMT